MPAAVAHVRPAAPPGPEPECEDLAGNRLEFLQPR